MSGNFFFAGFIMTYNRPETLTATIKTVFSQTYPPEKLWIIDNSDHDDTEKVISELSEHRLAYYRMGYNAGPAGAAAKGLELCAAAGCEWIFWGDDDDPPPFENTFEILFDTWKQVPNRESIGQMGIVGQMFRQKTGEIRRTPDHELATKEVIYVDTIAGGQCKVINSRVVKRGAQIESKLFFGFEELDFDIQVKKLGFLSIVPASLFKIQRQNSGRKEHIRQKLLVQESIWRQYYSTRNLLFILFKHRLFIALSYTLFKKSCKMILDFRKGFQYGMTSFKYNGLGIIHWILGIYGKKT